MIKNYSVSALNNLLKNKLYSFINISGLSIGLAACILIGLHVLDETSYDLQWENAERIYRVNTSIDLGNGMLRRAETSGSTLAVLKQNFPDEIELGSRVLSSAREIQFSDINLEEKIASVDRDFIKMFDFDVLAGSLDSALTEPGRIALDEALARKIFGEGESVGKVLTVNPNGVKRDYQVAAIYRLKAGNSVLDLPAMTLLDDAALPAALFGWGNTFFNTYLQLRAASDVEPVLSRLPEVLKRNIDLSAMEIPTEEASTRYALELQNIGELHLNSAFDNSRAGGNKMVILAFSLISILVLLTGCINFTILSTAKATQRAREVAVRKVVGATRLQLIAQYLGESFLVVLPSLVLSLALVELCLPFFVSLVGKSLAVPYGAPATWLALTGLLVAVGFIGGLYPAFVLAQYRPSTTLKTSRSRESPASISLRNMLVIFQFSVSIALMIATAVIYLQVQFAANHDPGFNKNNLLIVDNLLRRGEVSSRKEALKLEVAKIPGVRNASLSGSQPAQKVLNAQIFISYTALATGGSNLGIATLPIDADFFATYQVPVQAGRDFDEERDLPSRIHLPEDTRIENIVINASAARQLGFGSSQDALGNELVADGKTLAIVGVVADTHFFSMNVLPRAEVYLYSPESTDVLSIRYDGNPQTVLSGVSAVWGRVVGDAAMSTGFVAQNMEKEFAKEQTEARMLVSFALLSIVIACLGLFGSAAFTVERRTKEIGIRKVMGAEVLQIVRLLIWQFSRPVMLANFMAWPFAIWAMLNWLQRFPYQIDTLLFAPICVAAGLIAMSIACVTVGSTAAKAASTKPVLALRYE